MLLSCLSIWGESHVGDQRAKDHPRTVRNTTRSWDCPRRFNEDVEDRINTPNSREREDDFLLKGKPRCFRLETRDMPEIDRKIIQHCLNVNAECKPVQQKKRIFAPECNKAVTKEVEKLLEADFIRKVFYPNWLANVVMVKKSNGKWKMCVDFTDLNKACPKNSFPLPRID